MSTVELLWALRVANQDLLMALRFGDPAAIDAAILNLAALSAKKDA